MYVYEKVHFFSMNFLYIKSQRAVGSISVVSIIIYLACFEYECVCVASTTHYSVGKKSIFFKSTYIYIFSHTQHLSYFSIISFVNVNSIGNVSLFPNHFCFSRWTVLNKSIKKRKVIATNKSETFLSRVLKRVIAKNTLLVF